MCSMDAAELASDQLIGHVSTVCSSILQQYNCTPHSHKTSFKGNPH